MRLRRLAPPSPSVPEQPPLSIGLENLSEQVQLLHGPAQLQGTVGANTHQAQPHPKESREREDPAALTHPVCLLSEAPASACSRCRCGLCLQLQQRLWYWPHGLALGASNRPHACQPLTNHHLGEVFVTCGSGDANGSTATTEPGDFEARDAAQLYTTAKPHPRGRRGHKGCHHVRGLCTVPFFSSPDLQLMWQPDVLGYIQTSPSKALRSTENTPEVTTVTSQQITCSCPKPPHHSSSPKRVRARIYHQQRQRNHRNLPAQPNSNQAPLSIPDKNPSGRSSLGRQTRGESSSTSQTCLFCKGAPKRSHAHSKST